MLFNQLFTAGANLSQYYLHYKGNTHDGASYASGVAGTFDFVADPIPGTSRTVLRTRMTNADPVTYAGIRAEIIPVINRSASNILATPRDLWTAFEVMIPRTLAVWQDTAANPLVFFQLHDTPDVSDAVRQPTIHALLDAGTPRRIKISNMFDATDPSTATSYTAEEVGSAATIYGEWVSFVVHINQMHTSSGVLEIWRNGQKIVDKTGLTAANDVEMGHIKGGVYDFAHVGNLGTRFLYHSGFVVGDGAETLESMLAALGTRHTRIYDKTRLTMA